MPESTRAIWEMGMQPNPDRSPSPGEEPITVLLIGEQWGAAAPALQALESQGAFRFSKLISRSEFSEPRVSMFWAGAPDIFPAVIAVGPGVAPGDLDLHRLWDTVETAPPPLLDCITHEDLESFNVWKEADDFLVVPCTSAEMGLRLRRLAARDAFPLNPASLMVGEIALDLETYQVTVAGSRVGLAWLEFQLLKFLMENVGRVFSRDQLLANVWGVESFGGTRTVDVHIRRLRNKIETGGQAYFRTVKNVGYGMVDPG